jgi:hypothetical protein
VTFTGWPLVAFFGAGYLVLIAGQRWIARGQS